MNRETGEKLLSPRVKICGLTRTDEALVCARAGADAVGLVFYPPSPRFVTDETARAICESLPPRIWRVGVFVDEPVAVVLEKVKRCGLTAVQLHGVESPEEVDALAGAGVAVIKSLFAEREPSIANAPSVYRGAFAYLIESGRAGPLPGGNAQAWDWPEAKLLRGDRPIVLAGGLDPENVETAIRRSMPDAVDVSSGVEASPGRKDIEKVNRFLEAVSKTRCLKRRRRIFQ